MVVRAQLVETERGLVPEGDGWFVLNAREAEWWELRTGGGALCDFEGEPPFRQLGINLTLLEPAVAVAAPRSRLTAPEALVRCRQGRRDVACFGRSRSSGRPPARRYHRGTPRQSLRMSDGGSGATRFPPRRTRRDPTRCGSGGRWWQR